MDYDNQTTFNSQLNVICCCFVVLFSLLFKTSHKLHKKISNKTQTEYSRSYYTRFQHFKIRFSCYKLTFKRL